MIIQRFCGIIYNCIAHIAKMGMIKTKLEMFVDKARSSFEGGIICRPMNFILRWKMG